jgi:hypothetical protein
MYEDITGFRTVMSPGVIASTAAASTTEVAVARVMIHKPYTLYGLAIMAGTAAQVPAGSTMAFRVWVNGVRKGVGTMTLVPGAGSIVHAGRLLPAGITGPANSALSVSVAAAAATAGTNFRVQYVYHHGHKA